MNTANHMVGNINQLVKARRISFRDGVSDGVKAIELHNASGLYATCIEDQCLNIYDFSYKGINCTFQTKNSLVSNRFFNGGADEFSYYWPAGMMYTCGLTNVGTPCVENGIYHPQHGRIGMMPAENVSVEKTLSEVIVKGVVRDGMLCGHNFELERTIIFPCNGKEITIRDKVTNKEDLASEMMILYHCNFGYPLLTPKSRMVKGKGEITDNLGSAKNPMECSKSGEAQIAKEEEVYCHTNTADKDGYGYAAVINDEISLGCYVKYKMDTLPLLMQWKNFCTHDYAMGLEPSNSYILGRTEERKHGTLPVIDAHETKTFEIKIGILDGEEEISDFEKML